MVAILTQPQHVPEIHAIKQGKIMSEEKDWLLIIIVGKKFVIRFTSLTQFRRFRVETTKNEGAIANCVYNVERVLSHAWMDTSVPFYFVSKDDSRLNMNMDQLGLIQDVRNWAPMPDKWYHGATAKPEVGVYPGWFEGKAKHEGR
jgi:hypothetical protein